MKRKWLWSGSRKRLRGIRPGILLVLMALGITPLSAAIPDWLRAASRTTLPKYPDDTNAVLLLSEQVTTVNGGGDVKTAFRQAYKILRSEGRSFRTAAVHFDSETRLTYLKGWGISPQGVEQEVKEKDAVETALSAGTLYEDTRRKVLAVPGGEPGSVIGFEWEQKRRPWVSQGIWDFQEEIPVRRARFVLELPVGWQYEPRWRNYSAREPRAVGERRWEWELEDLPAVEREPAMPAWRAVAGRLAVAYGPRGSGPAAAGRSSWQEVGRWYGGLAAPRRQPSPAIQRKVAELTSSAPALLDKIKALAAFVQRDIRYVAIEIGIGGYQPHAARDVFVNRYGDCKDKTTLLATMLGEIGVQCYYLMIHTRRGVIAPEFPSALGFNHVIAAIRLPDEIKAPDLYAVLDHEKAGRLLLFDPTDPFTPLGHLPTELQANHGLLVTGTGGELVAVPLAPAGLNRLLRSGELWLTPTGSLLGEVQELSWGAHGVARRGRLLNAQDSERAKILESFLGDFLVNFRFTGGKLSRLQDFNEPLGVQYTFAAENYAKLAGNLLLFRPRVLGQKARDFLEGKPRKYPVEFPESSLESDSFDIKLPDGYQVDELPPPVQLKYPFAEYNSTIEAAGNAVRYKRVFQVKQVWVPVEQAGELTRFFREIAADERASVVLKRSAP